MGKSVQLVSDKQKEFVYRSTAKINLAHGSVRSGKTYGSLIRFAEAVANCPDDDIYMIGKTSETIYDNAVKLILYDKRLALTHCASWFAGKRILNLFGKNIKTLGAKDQSSVGIIQGKTISIAYVDEMTLIPTNFIDMLFTRLSNPHSCLFGTMNPSTPYHMLKKKIDKADGKEIYALHFTIDDNPFLPPGYKQFLESQFSGLFYRRNILGQWVMAEGAIFDFFDKNIHVIPRPPTSAQFYIASIDYGTGNAFACLIIGYSNRGSPRIWVEKEYYWDSKERGRQKTNSEYVRDLEDFLGMYPLKMIYVDPSALSFKLEMRKAGFSVVDADNDVENGIQTVSDFMWRGDLAICEDCPHLIEEIEGYIWNPKKLLLGTEEPLKEKDHGIDALRYGVQSHFGKKANIDIKTEEQIYWDQQAQAKNHWTNWVKG